MAGRFEFNMGRIWEKAKIYRIHMQILVPKIISYIFQDPSIFQLTSIAGGGDRGILSARLRIKLLTRISVPGGGPSR